MDDLEIRVAAFAHLTKITREQGEVLKWAHLSQPFVVGEEKVLLANRARGIFKPRQMKRGVLSIKTTIPRTGRDVRYEDLAVGENDGVFHYRFQGTSPENRDNIGLREAFEDGTPIIYLFGLQETYYQALWPVFISSWNPQTLAVEVSVQDRTNIYGIKPSEVLPVVRSPIERAYSTVMAKQRLHQSAFRLQVLDAYQHRCSVCGFPRDEILDAAHILPDHDERGRPEVSNGLCLCRLHHGAYDTDLMGIRPDGVIELSKALLETRDGPTLEYGLIGFSGKSIKQPSSQEDRPSKIFLEERFTRFKKAA